MAVRRPRRARTIGVTGTATAFMGGTSPGVAPRQEPYAVASIPDATAPAPLETPEEQAAREARERARAVRIEGLVSEDTADESSFSEMLRRYRENLPRQQRNALISANRMGLVNSTTRSEQEGDILTSHTRGETDMQTARNERKAAREAARRLLEAGGELTDAEALASAAQARGPEYEEMADEGMLAAVNPGVQSKLAPGIQARPVAGVQRTPGRMATGARVSGGRQQRTTGNARINANRRRPRRRR